MQKKWKKMRRNVGQKLKNVRKMLEFMKEMQTSLKELWGQVNSRVFKAKQQLFVSLPPASLITTEIEYTGSPRPPVPPI
jgi:tRNA U54 and U55 pseudouridine synthase Pus10